MRYLYFRFLFMALSAALIVCGAFMTCHTAVFLAAASLLAAATWTRGLCEIRTDALGFYGSLLVKSACVLWCLSEACHIGALAAFLGLNMTVDIQFAVIGLHLFSTDIKLTRYEAACSKLLPPLVIAASAMTAYMGYNRLSMWIVTAGFTLDSLSLCLLMRRIKKRL